MPRVAKPSKQRHDPLHVELEADDSLKKFGRVSKPGKRRARQEQEENEEVVSRLHYEHSTVWRLTGRAARMRGCPRRF